MNMYQKRKARQEKKKIIVKKKVVELSRYRGKWGVMKN